MLHQGDNACLYALAEAEHGELAVGLHIAEDFALRLTSGPHDLLLTAAMHSVLAHLRLAAGDLDGAAGSLEVAHRAGSPTLDFVGGLAIVTGSALCRQRGEPHAAASRLEQACAHLRLHGTTDIAMRVLEELGAVALALGRADHFANLLATAREARWREEKPPSPLCRARIDALQGRARQRRGNGARHAGHCRARLAHWQVTAAVVFDALDVHGGDVAGWVTDSTRRDNFFVCLLDALPALADATSGRYRASFSDAPGPLVGNGRR